MITIKISTFEDLDDKIDINNEKFRDIMYLYSKALKIMENKIDIIRYDYEYLKEHDSINHVMSRIKSPESILKKMQKDNLDITYKNMIANINDIAGIRIICPLKSNIYTVINYIKEFNDIEIIKEKDYIKHPKKSGYTSYHMIVKIPVYINEEISNVKLEIQIRSLAMDFWASLEHKIKYKSNGELNENVSKELVKCAKTINRLDDKMVRLFKNKGA